MSLILFFLVALLAASVTVLPLLPGSAERHPRSGAMAQPVSTVTDDDVEAALRALRRSRSNLLAVARATDIAAAPVYAAASCPACARPYQPGDRFCVGCGVALPQVGQAVCPACGARWREGDRFCAQCGAQRARPVEEAR